MDLLDLEGQVDPVSKRQFDIVTIIKHKSSGAFLANEKKYTQSVKGF